MTYLTIQRDIQHEIIIEKSRFICTLRKVESEVEATDYLKAIKKQYWDATHNCSAYIIGMNMEQQRSSDDGEPSGTAGIPMLEVLKKRGLHNVLAVVTRYFGGVKLGAGGLIRAYGRSVSEAIDAAGLAEKHLLAFCSFESSPEESGKILNLLYTQDTLTIADVRYEDRTTFVLQIKAEEKSKIEQILQELLNLSIQLTTLEEKFVEVPFQTP